VVSASMLVSMPWISCVCSQSLQIVGSDFETSCQSFISITRYVRSGVLVGHRLKGRDCRSQQMKVNPRVLTYSLLRQNVSPNNDDHLLFLMAGSVNQRSQLSMWNIVIRATEINLSGHIFYLNVSVYVISRSEYGISGQQFRMPGR